MMNCQNKNSLIVCLSLFGLAISPINEGYAQAVFETQEVSELDPLPQQDDNSQTPYFGAPTVPSIVRDQATGGPVVITPGPYLTPGIVEEDPFREPERPSFYEDNNVFTINESEAPATEQVNTFDLGIVEGRLEAIEPAALGLLDERTGGLPYNMWQGTNYETVVSIISRLPVATPSPTINELSELVLLSAAEVPLREGQEDNSQLEQALPDSNQSDQYIESEFTLEQEPEPKLDNNELLLARLNKVSETGKIAFLTDFLSALPSDIASEELREIKVNNALLSGDVLSACALAQDARAEDGGTNWLKILTYCRAIDGDRTGVSFNISLLQETGEAPVSFINFIEDVLSWSTGTEVTYRSNVIRPDVIDPLTIALVNTTKRELPLDVVESMPRLYLGSLTRRADLSIDFRAEVSELASLYGVMQGRVFSEVLEAMEFTDGERDSIFLLANSGLGARVDGLLINSAMNEQDRLRKAELISTAFERSLREKLYPALSYPLLDVVKTISPAGDLSFFAHDAGRIALYSGDWAVAKRWYDLLLTTATAENFEANRSLISLWPLMLMSDASATIPINGEIINLWTQSLSQLPEGEGQRRQELFHALLDVFGYEVEARKFDSFSADGYVNKMPSHGVWQSFLYSARAGRVGETLALGLIVLGEGWVEDVNISVLTSVLSVLRAMGFEDEARSLAIEAMIGNGF